ncbi:MAG: AAA-like domain-containing protein [Comamonas thiooxydans]
MKALRSLTIVPQTLYVERAADRQVESIIENMGRPGYVLVARQMGKTNLLLNAKKKRENSKEIFTYLDVSNPFPDVRSFFRNIVDLTLETAPGIPDIIREAVAHRRTELPRLAHIEHEWELRQIIRSGIKKLIICLDEIDALTRSDYSDHVFSFIRSIYFSGRSNFPELENITYLLSGVAEPSEIIKNKDVSPFNIGEKIYLDDFSLEEVQKFLEKANINLNHNSVQRIYHWTRGYPRMTWDVCSALEEQKISGIIIDVPAVDAVIKDLYFSGVEAPPIDHIKKLAEETPDIRDALISIHYGKSDGISDSSRTKLYLAGISRFSSEGDSVEFKNAVLEECLSEEYLHGLANHHSSLPSLDAAIEKIKLGQVYQGLEELQLLEPRVPETEIASLAFWRGRCYFELARYEDGTVEFERSVISLDSQTRIDSTLYLGVCYFRLQRYEKSAQTLSNWSDLPSDRKWYAAIWYAQCLVEQAKNLDEAERICQNVIASPSELLNSSPFLRMPAEAIAHSYVTAASIQTRRRQLEKARRILEQADQFSTADLKLKIYLLQADLATDSARTMWLRKAGQAVRDANDFRVQVDGQANSISVNQLGDLIRKEEQRGASGELKSIFDRVFRKNPDGLSVGDLIQQLVQFFSLRNAMIASFELVDRYFQEDIGEGSQGDDVRLLMGVLIRSYPQRSSKYWNAYLKYFEPERQPYVGEFVALNAIALFGGIAVGGMSVSLALDILQREPADAANMTAREASSLEMLRRYLPIYLSLSKSPTSGDIAAAKKLYTDLSSFSVFDLPGFSADHSRLMQEGLTVALRKLGAKPDILRGMRFGRNDYVRVDYDGDQRVGKFKKFESDLLASKCKIIGHASREESK